MNKWTKVADLQNGRCFSACTIFEGKIVATGGSKFSGSLRSVEAYDHHENKWTNLPDMLKGKSNHSAVSLGIKMFVIGKDYPVYCEVYDNISRKFTLLNIKIPRSKPFKLELKALSIKNKLVYFCNFNPSKKLKVHVYDMVKKKWLLKYNLVKDIYVSNLYFLKYPKT